MTEVNHKTPEERAKDALKEAGWEPSAPIGFETDLAAAYSHGYRVIVWGQDDEPLHYSVERRDDDSGWSGMWTRVLPRPEEVPTLHRRAERLGLLSDGADDFVHDPESGEVLVTASGLKALEAREVRCREQQDTGATEQAIRVLEALGYTVRKVERGIVGEPDTIVAERREN